MLFRHHRCEAFFVKLGISAGLTYIKAAAIEHCQFFRLAGTNMDSCVTQLVGILVLAHSAANIRNFAFKGTDWLFQKIRRSIRSGGHPGMKDALIKPAGICRPS